MHTNERCSEVPYHAVSDVDINLDAFCKEHTKIGAADAEIYTDTCRLELFLFVGLSSRHIQASLKKKHKLSHQDVSALLTALVDSILDLPSELAGPKLARCPKGFSG